MKTPLLIWCAAFAAFCATLHSQTDVAKHDPVVRLPPFHVNEYTSDFGFAWNATLKDEKVTTIRFSRVEAKSLANNAGLIVGDRLLAIDGRPVANLSLSEVQRLFARDWDASNVLTWNFTVERGLFGGQRIITLRMRRMPVEDAQGTPKSDPTTAEPAPVAK